MFLKKYEDGNIKNSRRHSLLSQREKLENEKIIEFDYLGKKIQNDFKLKISPETVKWVIKSCPHGVQNLKRHRIPLFITRLRSCNSLGKT